jgi:hypothetical protein
MLRGVKPYTAAVLSHPVKVNPANPRQSNATVIVASAVDKPA